MLRKRLWLSLPGVILALLAFLLLVLPGLQGAAGGTPAAIGYSSDTVQARVVQILEEGEVDLGEITQPYQVFDVLVLAGKYEGKIVRIEYGTRQLRPLEVSIQTGDLLLVRVGETMLGGVQGYFVDFVRSPALLLLFGVFVVISVLISGWKGIRSLVGISLSLLVILFFIIPNILAGRDPVAVSIIGSFTFLAVSQYLIYGWNLKTHAAVFGVLISIIFTGLLALLFVNLTRMTGFGDENAMFLTQQTNQVINIRGLLLGGMIIGTLGVLDDLVITQSSAVFELRAANNSLGARFLFHRAMNIGRDHIAATVNTLVLAYAGSALPMLLLFSLNNADYGMLVNIEFIAEEIVRTLVGSIGLFVSVPVATGLAALLAGNQQRLGGLRRLLGPENSWDAASVYEQE